MFNMYDTLVIPFIGILTNEDGDMKLKKIHLQNICNINDLELKFNDHVNVICGSNGIGKTTILKAIAESADTTKLDGLLNTNSNSGFINWEFDVDGSMSILEKTNESSINHNKLIDKKQILNFDSNRDIEYIALEALASDQIFKRSESRNFEPPFYKLSNISSDNLKNWFVFRYLYSTNNTSSFTTNNRYNLDTAINSISVLNKSISFKELNMNNNDILVSTPKGVIPFESLSSGYRSCFYVIIGIIKELEYRFQDININEFNSMILIDEIDLHLHPSWQSRLLSALKEIFPNAQFIVTTHSPSVLQSLQKDELIPLKSNDVGDVYNCLDELSLGQYGLQGWTLEEILENVMGTPSTSSDLYKETLALFDKAIIDEDSSSIKSSYELLNEMLHPSSNLRRILKIQTAGLLED